MSRVFCIPGVAFLAIAFILSFLVSISLPFLPAIDFVRVNSGAGQFGPTGNSDVDNIAIKQLRLGIWSACDYSLNNHKTCLPSHHGYEVPFTTVNSKGDIGIITVKAAWTRGLAVHPVATAVTFIALLLSFSTHVTVTLVASLVSFLAALLTLIAFAIDIALFVLVRNLFKENNNILGANTNTAPAFWMTFVTLIFLLLAGCTVCFGRRTERRSGATEQSYPLYEKSGIFSRFRRN